MTGAGSLCAFGCGACKARRCAFVTDQSRGSGADNTGIRLMSTRKSSKFSQGPRVARRDASALCVPLRGPQGVSKSFLDMATQSRGQGNAWWEDALKYAQSAYEYTQSPEAAAAMEVGKKLWPHVQNYGRKILGAIGIGSRVPRAQEVAKLIVAEAKEEKKLASAVKAARMGPKPYKNLMKTARTRGHESEGCEPLTSLTAPSGGWAKGAIMFQQRINPLVMGPQLKRCARMAELYRLGGTFECSCGAGTDTVGSFAAFVKYDARDGSISATNYDITQALATDGCKTLRVYEDMKVPIRTSNEPSRLFVDTDAGQERFTDVGTFYMVALQPIPEGTELGIVYFRWRLWTQIPNDEDSNPGGSAHVATVVSTAGMLVSNMAANVVSAAYVQPGSNIELRASQIVRAPPMHGRLTVAMTSTTALSPTSSHLFTLTPTDSSITVYTDVAKNFYLPSSDSKMVVESVFFSCSCDTWITFTPGADLTGSCSLRFWLNAMDFGPYSTSFTAFRRMEAAVMRAQAQQAAVERMMQGACRYSAPSASVQSSSSSLLASSTSSSSSSFARALTGAQEDYVLVRRA